MKVTQPHRVEGRLSSEVGEADFDGPCGRLSSSERWGQLRPGPCVGASVRDTLQRGANQQMGVGPLQPYDMMQSGTCGSYLWNRFDRKSKSGRSLEAWVLFERKLLDAVVNLP